MKIGARILKTGIAIVLALSLAQILGFPSPAFAGIAAIFAIQPTIFRSYRTVIEQIQGNVIGAAIAIIFVVLFGNHVFIIGLACVIVIMINVKINTQNTITLAVVTVIAIMENRAAGNNFFSFAAIRFSSILLGILSSFVVNLLFIPPKYETKLYHRITTISQEITKMIRITSKHMYEHAHIKGDIQSFKEQIIKLEQLYMMYKEDKELFKKASHAKARRLVVYRNMIATTKRALDILKKLNRYEYHFQQLPDSFQKTLEEQLVYLVNQHEHIQLKYIRKTKNLDSCEVGQGIEPKVLMNLFLELQDHVDEENEQALYHMMSLISAIIEYEEHIVHLDTLITSFHSFHQKDNKVQIEERPLEE